MRVILLAAGDFSVPTIESLHYAPHDIPFVITQPDRPRGRGRRLTPTPAKRVAEQLGLETVTAADVNDAALIRRVRSVEADVGLVIDFGQKIGPELRSACRGGFLNLHASLLPRLRGAAPFQWAILRGEAVTGVTVFKIVDRMDAGPVLTRASTPIGEHETADELHDRLARLGPNTVNDALDMFQGGVVPDGDPQDESQATKAPKLKKQDGCVDFNRPAVEVARRIRGLWSWPGASCRFLAADGSRDEFVTLARATVAETASRVAPSLGPPGELNEDGHVTAADGAVEILEIKPHGGRRMSWRDFANGRHVRPHDRFVSIEN